MRKFPALFLLTVVSFITMACSNFAMPERVRVKAEVNPNIPINSAKFNFTEKIQEELTNLFAGDTVGDAAGINIANYTGNGSDSPQTFLISFPLHKQSLDFQEYLSTDLDLYSDFKAINQTFKMEQPSIGDAKFFIDMSETIESIMGTITWTRVQTPVASATGASLPTISLPVSGFTSLSFYEGNLEITFSIPAEQNYEVTLSDLKINSTDLKINSTIQSNTSSVTLNSATRKQTVKFPLEGKTLTAPLTLNSTYSALNANPLSDKLDAEIKFSNDVKLKTVMGVDFDPINRKWEDGGADDISLDVPKSFVQAVIGKGSITLDASTAKGLNIDLSKTKIKQKANTDAPSNPEKTFEAGLDLTGPQALTSLKIDLEKQNINSKSITTTGAYSVSVLDAANTEITFTEDGKLEIGVSLDLQSLSEVYIDGREQIKTFNESEDKEISAPLGDLGKTVSSITLKEIGADLEFKKVVEGLKLTIKSADLEMEAEAAIVENQPGKKTRITKIWSPPNYYPYSLSDNPDINFTFILALQNKDAPVLTLTDIDFGKDVDIINCEPEVVFEWVEATIDPSGIDGSNDFTKGQFPKEGEDPFSLDSTDLILSGLEFASIDGYLFFNGPSFDETKITLKLYQSFDNSSFDFGSDTPFHTKDLTLGQGLPTLPEKGGSFEGNIEELAQSDGVNGPFEFADTFNEMLGGKKLRIGYAMDFGEGITIKKENIDGGEKVFKADLVLVVPLQLNAVAGGSNIDVTGYLGGLAGDDLLGFTKDMGDMAVSFNTLTLNIGLTGALMEEGELVITIDGRDDPISFDFNSNDISIALGPYLGPSQNFTIQKIELHIEKGGGLKIPRGLSLLSVGVKAGVDAVLEL